MKTSIMASFPFLAELSGEELDQLIHVDVKTGQTILSDGDSCHTAAFVYSGEIKITKINKNGREINLYKVAPGQTCILTVTSTISDQPYPAYAIASQTPNFFSLKNACLWHC